MINCLDGTRRDQSQNQTKIQINDLDHRINKVTLQYNDTYLSRQDLSRCNFNNSLSINISRGFKIDITLHDNAMLWT